MKGLGSRSITTGILVGSLLGACRGEEPGDAGSAARERIGARLALAPDESARLVAGAKGSARVRYQPEAKVMERDAALKTLSAVSSDGWTLLFERADPAIRTVEAGDVLVVKGLFARKVLATDAWNDTVAVLTGPAELGEVLQEGSLRIEAPVRFSPEIAATGQRRSFGERLLELGVPAAHAQDVGKRAVDLYKKAKKFGTRPVNLVANGWKTTFSAAPGPGRLDLSLELRRDEYGFRGLITGTGYVEDFELDADIGVERGALERLDVAFRRVNGLMNFTWEVGKETPGGHAEQTKIKLPGAFTIPLYQLLDGFPLFLEFSSAIIIQPVLTGGQQYSHGAFRVTYDGAQHFRARAGNIDPEGKVTGTIAVLNDRHLSALAPVGMVINLAAPRIELTLSPLRMLNEVQGGTLQKTLEDGAKKVDAIARRLLNGLKGTSLADRVPAGLAEVGLGKVANAMKSDAAAYLQLVTSSSTTHSGASAITPCTHMDVAIAVSVGASAQAFGQQVGHVGKNIFEHKITRVSPPGTRLCNY